MHLSRYAKDHSFLSPLDPFQDVLVLIEYLTANDYLDEVLRQIYGLGKPEARLRAKQIKPHVRIALEYAQQSLNASPNTSFLPAYYSILNLLKVYILLGKFHDDLPAHRWHGAQYKGHEKDSQNLLTERVTLHKGGAISLAYRTITNQVITKPIDVSLSDIISYQSSIAFEYFIATKMESRIASLDLTFRGLKNGKFVPVVRAETRDGAHLVSCRNLKILSGFKKRSDGLFYGTPFSFSSGTQTDMYELVRPQFHDYLLYGDSSTPISGKSLLMPEELPIALLFFHMSSVVRYKPEFLEKLTGTRYWPLLRTAQRHSLLRFLYLFWSYVHKENLFSASS